MKIILCGYKLIGCEILRLLIDQKHEVFVYTHESPYFIHDLKKYVLIKKLTFHLIKYL